MSLGISPLERNQHFSVSNSMGTSTIVLHRSTDSESVNSNDSRREHKHKKHRKQRLEKKKSKSKTDLSGSCKNSEDKKGKYEDVSIGDKNIEDQLQFSGRIEDMPDFSWLTTDFKFSEITDTFESDVKVSLQSTDLVSPEAELSQRGCTPPNLSDMCRESTNQLDERAIIEQQIQDKYAEIDFLVHKIRAKRHRSKKRRKHQSSKHDSAREYQRWISSTVNIYPIRREKRCAQPIREALLVRTAMKKAWKGLLGSCCGKGCWATWKWINLRGVMSDYE